MPRVPTFWTALLCLVLSLPCAAQDLVPFIRLSPGEVAKAKQLTQSLKDAQERSKKAKLSWEQFCQSYQAAHSNMRSLKFTDDLSLAVAETDSVAVGIFQAVSIELTAEEHKKLENIRHEMTESQQSQKQAEIAWADFNGQLVADHLGNIATGTAYSDVTLSSGKHVRIYTPWSTMLRFTSDFKLAFPIGL